MTENTHRLRDGPRPLRRLFLKAPLALAACRSSREIDAELARRDMFLDFCVPAPRETSVAPDVEPRHRFWIEVPAQAPSPEQAFATKTLSVSQNDVVALSIQSTTYGAAGIHGLTAIEKVAMGEPILLRFRAIYQGRFGVHFHGSDGSHYEVIALHVV